MVDPSFSKPDYNIWASHVVSSLYFSKQYWLNLSNAFLFLCSSSPFFFPSPFLSIFPLCGLSYPFSWCCSSKVLLCVQMYCSKSWKGHNTLSESKETCQVEIQASPNTTRQPVCPPSSVPRREVCFCCGVLWFTIVECSAAMEPSEGTGWTEIVLVSTWPKKTHPLLNKKLHDQSRAKSGKVLEGCSWVAFGRRRRLGAEKDFRTGAVLAVCLFSEEDCLVLVAWAWCSFLWAC